MTNRIVHLELHDASTVPAEAEVRLVVVPERLTPTTEVRGRLMGPRCRFASTVEVAYHFRPLPPGAAVPAGALAVRALIPEASLWAPETPFLYEGPVELWEEGGLLERVAVRHGLRHLGLGPAGLRVNGRPLPLRGRELASCSEEQALELRRAGYNLVVVPAEAGGAWAVADAVGLFVLGRAGSMSSRSALPAERTRHPSHLGWLGAEAAGGLDGLALVEGQVCAGDNVLGVVA
jgi:hypothetical protein